MSIYRTSIPPTAVAPTYPRVRQLGEDYRMVYKTPPPTNCTCKTDRAKNETYVNPVCEMHGIHHTRRVFLERRQQDLLGATAWVLVDSIDDSIEGVFDHGTDFKRALLSLGEP